MERINRIMEHPVFQRELNKINRLEADRRYCRHGMTHLMDVARIGWIMSLEQGKPFEKDIMYAAALLHDIGKGIQYEDGTPHNLSSAELASPILKECGYSGEEIDCIVNAIRLHRKKTEDGDALTKILYDADKRSRACFTCSACEDCHWDDNKKNKTLEY